MIRTMLFVVTLMLASCVTRLLAADANPTLIDASGIVTDQFGKPISGAQAAFVVSNRAADGAIGDVTELSKTRSDATGRFEMKGLAIDRPRGDYSVRATADGFAYGRIGLSTGGAEQFYSDERHQWMDQAWIVLLPAEKLEGVIVDEQNHPISGARVIEIASQQSTVTGADGNFVFDKSTSPIHGALGGGRRLRITHPDYVSTEMADGLNAFAAPIGRGPQTITLRKGIRISGRITEKATDKPLGNIPVEASNVFKLADARTDQNGRYSFQIERPVNRETKIEISFLTRTIESPDTYFRPASRTQMISLLTPNDHIEDVDFQLAGQPAVIQRGIITMEDNAPLPTGLSVTALSDFVNGPDVTGRIEGNRFALPALPAGDYALRITRDVANEKPQLLLKQPITIAKEAADLNVIIPRFVPRPTLPPLPGAIMRPALHGTVINTDGRPVALAKVLLVYKSESHPYEFTFTNLDGNYDFKAPPSSALGPSRIVPAATGAMEIIAWSPSMEQASVTEMLSDFLPHVPVDLRLEASPKVSGRIRDPLGRPVANIPLAMQRCVDTGPDESDYGNLFSTLTDEEGHYALGGIVTLGAGARINIDVQPYIDRIEHFNVSAPDQPVPANLDGCDFTIDFSGPVIRVRPDNRN